MTRTLLCCLFAVIALTGCGSTKEVTKWKTKYVFVQMEASMYSRVPAIAPPNEDVYVKADWQERERLLYQALTANYGQLGICNRQMSAIQEWTVKNKAIYDPPSTK